MQPNVCTVVRNDIFRLNAAPAVKYGAFAWLQNEHTTSEESGLITYNFTFFHVDRLTEDRGNEVAVQSQAIETLENILRTLPDYGLFPSSYSFRCFNQRFSDECAGAFCNVALDAEKDTLCASAFDFVEAPGSFNLDFNEDFKVWTWKTEGREIIII